MNFVINDLQEILSSLIGWVTACIHYEINTTTKHSPSKFIIIHCSPHCNLIFYENIYYYTLFAFMFKFISMRPS